MNYYLAGHLLGSRQEVYDVVRTYLTSYAYAKDTQLFVRNASPGSKLMVDSGAYTVYTQGQTLTCEEYRDWLVELRETLPDHIELAGYFNLDVIGDQAKTWENQERMEALGEKPIPIITKGASEKHILRALDEYDYFALGGLVPYSSQVDELKRWIGYVFLRVMRHWNTYPIKPFPRVHLLGVGRESLLRMFPVFSCDSSSWLSSVQYGAHRATKYPGVPRRSSGGSGVENAVIRSAVRKVYETEERVTQLWEGRGVAWM